MYTWFNSDLTDMAKIITDVAINLLSYIFNDISIRHSFKVTNPTNVSKIGLIP